MYAWGARGLGGLQRFHMAEGLVFPCPSSALADALPADALPADALTARTGVATCFQPHSDDGPPATGHGRERAAASSAGRESTGAGADTSHGKCSRTCWKLCTGRPPLKENSMGATCAAFPFLLKCIMTVAPWTASGTADWATFMWGLQALVRPGVPSACVL